jgi:lysophospholipase L1-like esterase
MKAACLRAFVAAVCLAGCAQQRAVLDPAPESRIVVMGNAFAERMPLYGWFEAALQARFPDRRLSVRNMGWSGDTPGLQPRELNFGTMLEHLGVQRADIIIAAYGMNESFDGQAGLYRFRSELDAWVTDMKTRRFNGRSVPQIILVSPIAHEDLGAPLPDGKDHNADLGLYTRVMREVATARQVAFVDLFTPARRKMAGKGLRLTTNGIHLNDYGYWWAAREMADQLGLAIGAPRARDDATAAISELRTAVWDKDWHFFLRWRPVNMEYIRGRRREPYGIENFPRELEQLDRMVEERDRRIWAMPKPGFGQLWQSPPSGPAPWKTLPGHAGADE